MPLTVSPHYFSVACYEIECINTPASNNPGDRKSAAAEYFGQALNL